MKYFFVFLLFLIPTSSFCGEIYKKPKDFVFDSFGGKIPKIQTLNLNEDDIHNIKLITKQKYNIKKVRYWQEGTKIAFILEDIGKTKPITTGYLIENSEINEVKVLIYRESHGWEVKYPFFTNQFKEVSLDDNNKLSKHIESISGATLSVNALKRMAKIALYLSSKISTQI